jgi:DNA repair exonuclease SbcCD ATPase subunit
MTEQEEPTIELRQAIACLYLAVPDAVADDVATKANAVLDALSTAESRVQELEGERDEALNSGAITKMSHWKDVADLAERRAEAAESHLARLEEATREMIEAAEDRLEAMEPTDLSLPSQDAGYYAAGQRLRDAINKAEPLLLTHSTPPRSDG